MMVKPYARGYENTVEMIFMIIALCSYQGAIFVSLGVNGRSQLLDDNDAANVDLVLEAVNVTAKYALLLLFIIPSLYYCIKQYGLRARRCCCR
jgi:hypothetical protein